MFGRLFHEQANPRKVWCGQACRRINVLERASSSPYCFTSCFAVYQVAVSWQIEAENLSSVIASFPLTYVIKALTVGLPWQYIVAGVAESDIMLLTKPFLHTHFDPLHMAPWPHIILLQGTVSKPANESNLSKFPPSFCTLITLTAYISFSLFSKNGFFLTLCVIV